jgi:hypothetical protein
MFGWLRNRSVSSDTITLDGFLDELDEYAEALEWRDMERGLIRQIRMAEINGLDSSKPRAQLRRLQAMK